MARELFSFDQPERFVVGTIGQPGERQFFLQVRDARRTVTVALEKQQVQLLAERVDGLLDEVTRLTGGSVQIPAGAPVGSDDLEPLDSPVFEEFTVGSLVLGWSGDAEMLVIEAHEPVDEGEQIPDLEEDPEDGPATLRVRLSGAAGRAFAKRALAVVSAGRPPCPFCALPLEPTGHICPRANGYRR